MLWPYVSLNRTALQFHGARTSTATCATDTRIYIIRIPSIAKIFTAFVEIERPRGDFHGKVIEYIVENGEVVLVDRHGKPAHDDTGKKYSHKLAEGDNPKQIAARLTKDLRKALRGSNASPRGFSGPINYPKSWNSAA